MLLTEMAVTYGQAEKSGLYAVIAAVNAVAARGAGFVTVQLRIEYPSDIEKARIYGMLKPVRAFCGRQKIGLKEEIFRSPAVSRVQTIATAAGWKEENAGAEKGADKRRSDILITNWIGLGGTLRIYWEKRRQLEERFPVGFLRKIEEMEPCLFTGEGTRLAMQHMQSGTSYNIGNPEETSILNLYNLAVEAAAEIGIAYHREPVLEIGS